MFSFSFISLSLSLSLSENNEAQQTQHRDHRESVRISPRLRPSSTTASTSHRHDKLPSLANLEPVAIEEHGPLDRFAEATDLRLLRPREYSPNTLSAQSRSSTHYSPANCSNSLQIQHRITKLSPLLTSTMTRSLRIPRCCIGSRDLDVNLLVSHCKYLRKKN